MNLDGEGVLRKPPALDIMARQLTRHAEQGDPVRSGARQRADEGSQLFLSIQRVVEAIANRVNCEHASTFKRLALFSHVALRVSGRLGKSRDTAGAFVAREEVSEDLGASTQTEHGTQSQPRHRCAVKLRSRRTPGHLVGTNVGRSRPHNSGVLVHGGRQLPKRRPYLIGFVTKKVAQTYLGHE